MIVDYYEYVYRQIHAIQLNTLYILRVERQTVYFQSQSVIHQPANFSESLLP